VPGGTGESRFCILRPASPSDGLPGIRATPSRLDSLRMTLSTSFALGRSAEFVDSSFFSSWYSFDGRSGLSRRSSWKPFQSVISALSRSMSSSSSWTAFALWYGRRPKHMKYSIMPSENMSDLVVKLPNRPVLSFRSTSGAQYEMVPVEPVELRSTLSGWTSPKSLIRQMRFRPSRCSKQLLGLRSRWM